MGQLEGVTKAAFLTRADDFMNVKSVHFYSQGRLKQLQAKEAELGRPFDAGQWVRMLRVAAWFETLRCRSGLPNAYGLGEQISPSGHDRHSNLWVKYAQGIHQPSDATLAVADASFPGSSIIFRSSIWKGIDVTQPLNGTGDSLIASLSAPVQLEYFDTKRLAHGLFIPSGRPPRRTAAALAELSSLDALAGLVIMLRSAHEKQDRPLCFAMGRAVHDCLILVGHDSPIQLMALDMYCYFSSYILPLTQCRGIALASTPDQLQQQADLISSLVLELEDQGATDYMPGRRRPLHDLLRLGFSGFSPSPLRPSLTACKRFSEGNQRVKLVDAWNDSLDRSIRESIRDVKAGRWRTRSA